MLELQSQSASSQVVLLQHSCHCKNYRWASKAVLDGSWTSTPISIKLSCTPTTQLSLHTEENLWVGPTENLIWVWWLASKCTYPTHPARDSSAQDGWAGKALCLHVTSLSWVLGPFPQWGEIHHNKRVVCGHHIAHWCKHRLDQQAIYYLALLSPSTARC